MTASTHMMPVNDLPVKVRNHKWDPHNVVTSAAATKVGISRNKVVRLQNLQSWVPEKLTLVWSAQGPQQTIRRVEAAVHADLAPARLFGEWFSITPETAVTAVKKQMEAHGLT